RSRVLESRAAGGVVIEHPWREHDVAGGDRELALFVEGRMFGAAGLASGRGGRLRGIAAGRYDQGAEHEQDGELLGHGVSSLKPGMISLGRWEPEPGGRYHWFGTGT